MFGEEKMKDLDYKSIDNKKRIMLPKFTKAEENEVLVLYKEKKFLSIYSEKTFDEKMSQPKTKNFFEEKKHYDELEEKLFGTAIVKSQNRIIIPKEVMDYYGFINKVKIKGATDHINIYKNDEAISKKRVKKLRIEKRQHDE